MFQIILREGITGGFVGPTLRQMVEIRGDDTGASIVHANLKPESKTEYTSQVGTLAADQVQTLVSSLVEQLKSLPTEHPTGSEDIYGLDTSIGFFSDDFQWQNGGPEGCSHGTSSNKATDQQKQTFGLLAKTLVQLGEQNALQNSN
ncbi:hypothetical protein DM01DRAFT_1383747 [Hesseltinella vesiculosa]|uniref:Uncharacterized protein n=1 Tax=Hesseltinella vesiculosa TaxID=101127 RepID=A0A1X2GGC0_9FUNG|nr:hypothetical protein DM01DRAFT_1383747 [Hesseltinella vesiculosa]